ncbi:permease [bacterium]|nr:permease [bacterium]
MADLLQHLWGILAATGNVILESGVYLMFGFLFAGLVGAFLRPETIAKYLGGNRLRSVVNASLLGVPIPLCSCGVISAATGLRKQGAGRAATLSFLTSTPQTGLDSIALSWGLLGPALTLVRVVSACLAAFLAGMAEVFWGRDGGRPAEPAPAPVSPRFQPKLATRVKLSLRSTFGMVFNDILTPLWMGLLAAGAIGYFAPPELVQRYLGTEWYAMFVALGVGLPLYICATASTPIVASLLAAGMSPGAAVVFLLAGPATNASTMTVVGHQLGRRSLVMYLGSIIVTSLALGWTTNLLFAYTGWSTTASVHIHEHGHGLRQWMGAILFVAWSVKLYFDRWRKRQARLAPTRRAAAPDGSPAD